MSQIEELRELQRVVTSAKELTDSIVFSVLRACSPPHAGDKLYVLQDFCSYGAWEQAALWVASRAVPRWRLSLDVLCGGAPRVSATLLSWHAPPFTVTRDGHTLAHAILLSILQSRIVGERWGINPPLE